MSLTGSVADVLANRAQWGMAFGCSRQVMRSSLPAECVHVVCASPPYWGLRAYSPEARPEEIGREKTPGEYVDAMVDVGRAVRHVLRQDGAWILNLGDTYASGEVGRHDHAQAAGLSPGAARSGRAAIGTGMGGRQQIKIETDVQSKNLLLIPSRVALALQADGWIVRSAVPWIKMSCMPESVTDRLTVAHETVFMLVRSKRYFWDADAVRVEHAIGNGGRHIWLAGLDSLEEQLEAYLAHVGALRERKGMLTEPDGSLAGLLVNPVPYTGAHFAAYPPRLIAPLIRAATSERGCCPHCGAQWRRMVERTDDIDPSAKGSRFDRGKTGVNGMGRTQAGERTVKRAVGFSPSCTCPAHEPIPPVVLDPFGGSGTTSQVARALGLRSILVDLYEKHAPLIRERMAIELDPAELKPIPRPEAPQDERQLAFAI